jgi:hypothetical protein
VSLNASYLKPHTRHHQCGDHTDLYLAGL